MKAYHFYLFRHGLTEGNEQGRYVGRLDLPLSARGRRELARLHEKYVYPRAEVFFSSPARRCLQSLEILYPGAQPTVVPDLAECDFGEYEGKTLDELKDDPHYRQWASGSAQGNVPLAPPGGESSPDFQKRTCRAFGELVTQLTSTGVTRAAVMVSGGTIMTLLSVFGLPRRPFFEWTSRCGRGYEVLVTPQLWMNGRVMEVRASVPNERNTGEPDGDLPAQTAPAGEPADGKTSAPDAPAPDTQPSSHRPSGHRPAGGRPEDRAPKGGEPA